MSDYIPFDIQSQIMKRLPVKSLIQFRSVCKQWKSFIDGAEFIKNYHINHTNPQHHLLLNYRLDLVRTYTSIIDNNTFPKQKFHLSPPKSLTLLEDILLINSGDGLLCFSGFYGGSGSSTTKMVVIWNPTIRKSVSIVIPIPNESQIVVGFGVCPDTSGPKLVKIIVDKISGMWVVEVFTLGTRVWKSVYMGAPFKSCYLMWRQVCVDGVVYFRAYHDIYLDHRVRSNLVMSFGLKSEKFGEVCLPERLVHTPCIEVVKVNESLGLLEYCFEGEMTVCGVWTKKDGANNPFTKIYTVKFESKGMRNRVLGFRNNGEAVMEMTDDDNSYESGIEVYEPSSGHTNGVGINGRTYSFFVKSYMETLLLLDESEDSIIY